jgi:hypothetical protein
MEEMTALHPSPHLSFVQHEHRNGKESIGLISIGVGYMQCPSHIRLGPEMDPEFEPDGG